MEVNHFWLGGNEMFTFNFVQVCLLTALSLIYIELGPPPLGPLSSFGISSNPCQKMAIASRQCFVISGYLHNYKPIALVVVNWYIFSYTQR